MGVCCAAAVVKDSVFSIGVLKYVVCLCKGYDGCSCMGSMSVFVMWQFSVSHDLRFVNAG